MAILIELFFPIENMTGFLDPFFFIKNPCKKNQFFQVKKWPKKIKTSTTINFGQKKGQKKCHQV
jgi:hypothetical protein